MKILWTHQAYERLRAIEDYITLRSSSQTAIAMIDLLIKRAETLADFPYMGRSVEEFIGADLREIIEGNYRIVYRIRARQIEILTVFEGHRLFPQEDL